MAKVKKVQKERLEDILWERRERLYGTVGIAELRDMPFSLAVLKFIGDRYRVLVDCVLALHALKALANSIFKISLFCRHQGQ